MCLAVCPRLGPGSILNHGWSISRELSLADHTLSTRPNSAWQKRLNLLINGTTQPADKNGRKGIAG